MIYVAIISGRGSGCWLFSALIGIVGLWVALFPSRVRDSDEAEEGLRHPMRVALGWYRAMGIAMFCFGALTTYLHFQRK